MRHLFCCVMVLAVVVACGGGEVETSDSCAPTMGTRQASDSSDAQGATLVVTADTVWDSVSTFGY